MKSPRRPSWRYFGSVQVKNADGRHKSVGILGRAGEERICCMYLHNRRAFAEGCAERTARQLERTGVEG